MKKTTILAPVKGKVIPLEQVPDEVFAEKVLGDGVAIIPEEGKIYSPVDGTITTITDSLHAYGFETEDGVQMIVHFGLETVNLKGKGFVSKVKVGDKVKAGDLVAEVDLDYLKNHHVETITPVIVCGGIPYDELMFQYGETEAKDVLIRTKESQPAAEPVGSGQSAGASQALQASQGEDSRETKRNKKAVKENKEVTKETKKRADKGEKKKFPINFDFLQKLGKVLMTVIAVMPAAGLMISIGNLIVIVGGDISVVNTIGTTVSEIGWGIINNLHILFAAAIGGSWAKERAGGAFAAVIAFCLINVITGAVLGVSSDMLADPNAVTHTLFGQEILVADYFVDILGKPALNMGVFVGIISGFVGANAYNKYYNFRKLPDALSFFNGKRFVPLVVVFYSAVTAIILSIIWPVVQTGINNFGIWIANSSDTSPILAPFVYGTLERLLLPFGLHHMLTIPMNYTSFGGTYTILTGANAGTQVFGQDPLWLAWVTDLINLKDAGDMAAYQNLLTTVTPARFKVGQMIGATGLLLGIALAMYRRVEPGRKKQYKSIFFSTVAAVFLTGVTEPLEFMFMFAALPLYIIYAILQGCAFAMAGIVDLRLHSFGNLEFITRIPMSIKAGLGGDIIHFLICVVVFFVIGYFVAYFMIGKFKYATPGRLGNYMEEEEEEGGKASAGQGSEKAERIIALLGGRENITLVDACMTRLRVTVKDVDKVADLPAWKAEGAMGLIKKDNGIQAVYGPKADVLKSDINDIL
ncbi:MAG TPA: PTS transporter subunit IIBC [Candidatus Anaerobutyricum faecale]|nr:PTS transporter subunit IIBC [Candidatus Anaerobutyricum faecale]